MTRSVQDVLTSFDRLSPHEQHLAVVEILRRIEPVESDLSVETLDRLADELFESMDLAESGSTDADSNSR